MNMPRPIGFVSFVSSLIALLSTCRAAEQAPLDVPALELQIENAMYAADPNGKSSGPEIAQFESIAKQLDVALKAAPKAPDLLYLHGLLEFASAATERNAHNPAGVANRNEQAVSWLKKVQGEPWQSEAEALEAYTLYQLIGTSGYEDPSEIGGAAAKLFSHAAQANPSSPRVLLFKGLVTWSTPAQYGGDQKAGLATLQAALASFEKRDHGGPQWGKSYTLGWIGTMLRRKGDLTGAEKAFRDALETNPNNQLIKVKLLPSLLQAKTKAAAEPKGK